MATTNGVDKAYQDLIATMEKLIELLDNENEFRAKLRDADRLIVF